MDIVIYTNPLLLRKEIATNYKDIKANVDTVAFRAKYNSGREVLHMAVNGIGEMKGLRFDNVELVGDFSKDQLTSVSKCLPKLK